MVIPMKKYIAITRPPAKKKNPREHGPDLVFIQGLKGYTGQPQEDRTATRVRCSEMVVMEAAVLKRAERIRKRNGVRRPPAAGDP